MNDAQAASGRVQLRGWRPRRLAQSPAVVFAIAVVLLLLIALRLPNVLSRSGLMSLLVLAAVLGIASVGQTLTVVLGGIDISIPAVIGMADVLLAYLHARGWSFVAIVALVAVLACLVGSFNGLISSLLGLHPLVVTLATASIVSGGVLQITNGRPGGSVPGFITAAVSPVGSVGFLPIPGAVLVWIVVTAVVVWVTHRTVFGRRVYFTGDNRLAARLALVGTGRVQVVTYAVSALCAALAGLLLGGFSGGASADVGAPYLFSTVTAVVVGGTSLLGGRGGYGRTVAGALITTEVTALLIGLGFGPSMQEVLLGVVILVLVLFYGRERRIADQI